MTIVDKNESVIVKLNIDQFEKPVIADFEQSNPNPLLSNESFTVVDGTLDNTNNDNPNGLPFKYNSIRTIERRLLTLSILINTSMIAHQENQIVGWH